MGPDVELLDGGDWNRDTAQPVLRVSDNSQTDLPLLRAYFRSRQHLIFTTKPTYAGALFHNSHHLQYLARSRFAWPILGEHRSAEEVFGQAYFLLAKLKPSG